MGRVIAVNLLAPMELIRLLMSSAMGAKDASLIFVGSLSNRLGYPGAAVYAATKQGLESFASSLHKTGAYLYSWFCRALSIPSTPDVMRLPAAKAGSGNPRPI